MTGMFGGPSSSSSRNAGRKNRLKALFGHRRHATTSCIDIASMNLPPSPSRGYLKVRTLEESCSSVYGSDDEERKNGVDEVDCAQSTSCDTSKTDDETLSSTGTPPQPSSNSPLRQSCPKMMTRNVSFSDVNIFSHKITLGDNPSVNDGPPVTLDWQVVRKESFDLEQYEAAKGPNAHLEPEEMKIPGWLRNYWLREQGISNRKLIKVQREVQRIHKSREAEIDKAMSEVYTHRR